MGKAGDGLQAQVRLFAQLLLLFLKLQLRPTSICADSRFLNPDLLRIGDNDVEGGVADDRNILGSIRCKGQLDGSCKHLINRGGRIFS